MSEDSDEILDTAQNQARRDRDGLGFSLQGTEKTRTIRSSSPARSSPARSIAGSSRGESRGHLDHGSESDADSEGSSVTNEFLEFDVYEREGFDKIMQTVACGGSSQGQDYAQSICDYLEVFESLTPNREAVGYLICDQLTLERYGNRRFQNMAKGFLESNELHVIVTDMHAELLALASRASFADRSLIRSFPDRDDPTKVLDISAALIRRHPALSLFVSRIHNNNNSRGLT